MHYLKELKIKDSFLGLLKSKNYIESDVCQYQLDISNCKMGYIDFTFEVSFENKHYLESTPFKKRGFYFFKKENILYVKIWGTY